MKTSESVKNIFVAQIAMQKELQNIAKDSKGYGYKYTSLEKLIEYIKPILNKHGLGYIQTTTSTEDNKIGVTTRLIHNSGEWIEDTMVAPLTKLAKMNEYQVAGSVITYFRRYALSAMVGIASDEDIDVSTPQQHPQEQEQDKNNTAYMWGIKILAKQYQLTEADFNNFVNTYLNIRYENLATELKKLGKEGLIIKYDEYLNQRKQENQQGDR